MIIDACNQKISKSDSSLTFDTNWVINTGLYDFEFTFGTNCRRVFLSLKQLFETRKLTAALKLRFTW